MAALPEPWMRGPIEGVHPFLTPVLYSFQMAREDLEEFTAGLSDASIWATPHGLTSVGFHILHIAGSTGRQRLCSSYTSPRKAWLDVTTDSADGLTWVREEAPVWDADKSRVIGGAPEGAFVLGFEDGQALPGEWWAVRDADESAN